MSSKIRLGINGFGRIGRLTTRILLSKFADQVDIVAVNDLTDASNLAYLFKYDSTYRQFNGEVSVEGSDLIINGDKIKVLAEKDPSLLPWGELGVDVVLECTGRFLSRELASLHLKGGAKAVLLSAPAKDADILTVVQGVNIPTINSSEAESVSYPDTGRFNTESIISNASCTTNCIAPALKALEDELKILQVNAITIHAYTATQPLQDGPSQKEWRDGRAAAVNGIPSKTGAAKAVELVLPELKGKVSLSALRVPVITGSMVYVVADFGRAVTVEEVNNSLKKLAETNMKGVLEYGTDEYVSGDVIGNSHSCLVDSSLTKVLGNKAEITIWYDNEWGYSNRLAELMIQKAKTLN